MILHNKLKPKVLLVYNSPSRQFIDSLDNAFDVLRIHSADDAIKCAKNTFEPDGIILDLMIEADEDAALKPPVHAFWLVDQLRDIPVCFDIPIAVISKISEHQLGTELKRNNPAPPRCRFFLEEDVEQVIDYIRNGDLPAQRFAN